jgi:hypothetical protein
MLNIKDEMRNMDLRNFKFYDEISDEQRKAFSPFIAMRYAANCQGDVFFQEHYLETVNELVNKNLWSLTKNHPKLLWMTLASCGTGAQFYHPYIAIKSKGKASSKFVKLLQDIYPSRKLDDLETWASMMTKDDKKEFFDMMGLDKKQRKEYE